MYKQNKITSSVPPPMTHTHVKNFINEYKCHIIKHSWNLMSDKRSWIALCVGINHSDWQKLTLLLPFAQIIIGNQLRYWRVFFPLLVDVLRDVPGLIKIEASYLRGCGCWTVSRKCLSRLHSRNPSQQVTMLAEANRDLYRCIFILRDFSGHLFHDHLFLFFAG